MFNTQSSITEINQLLSLSSTLVTFQQPHCLRSSILYSFFDTTNPTKDLARAPTVCCCIPLKLYCYSGFWSCSAKFVLHDAQDGFGREGTAKLIGSSGAPGYHGQYLRSQSHFWAHLEVTVVSAFDSLVVTPLHGTIQNHISRQNGKKFDPIASGMP